MIVFCAEKEKRAARDAPSIIIEILSSPELARDIESPSKAHSLFLCMQRFWNRPVRNGEQQKKLLHW